MNKPPLSLGERVSTALEHYFACFSAEEQRSLKNLHPIVIKEVEKALFQVLAKYTNNNQSQMARMLGLSRGTLRKRLAQFYE
jgi:Fis family transcriptional regulator, factor for inversion stimulation protein